MNFIYIKNCKNILFFEKDFFLLILCRILLIFEEKCYILIVVLRKIYYKEITK